MGKRSKCNKAIAEGSTNDNSNKVLKKKIKFEESDTVESAATPSQETEDKTKTKKQKKKSPANAKIIEDDGETLETQSDLSEEKDANKKKKNKRKDLSQNDEEEVKESDIDQFCDEITEEDNVQYENWVKLIEAKLHSNIKKPK